MRAINQKLLTSMLCMMSLPAFAAEMEKGMDMSMPGMDMSTPTKAKPATARKSKAIVAAPAKVAVLAKAQVKAPKDTAKAMPAMDMSKMDHNQMNMKDGQMDMSKVDHSQMNMKDDQMDMSKMDHSQMNMKEGQMDMSNMDHSQMDMPGMDHGGMDMGGMTMGNKMQGGAAPADARSPDYSQGRDFGPIPPPHMMGTGTFANLLVNQLEVARDQGKTIANYDLEGWVGNDNNRLAIKAEGSTSNGDLEDARTELLWRKPVTTFWNTELGVRQDSGAGKDRTWLALGLQGISPYWVDLSGTVYVGDAGRAALRLEATYDWRITQRLILQPTLETNIYSKNDPAREIGRGVSDLQAGLRLRYDITRQFAPYIGVQTEQRYGKTAEYVRAKGESVSQTMAVAGVRLWF
ncbi:copper resistance protein B [Aquirhabdus sp.]|uniref:copper resistance protein B n=1 Tax=Aquirhabdus sp. TaxID=2824160 RepID=UPI00396CA9AB